MADLATIEELALLLGLSEAQAELKEDLLTQLLDGAESLFESDAGRSDTPFQSAETDRVETHDGRRSPQLWLAYPIGDVTGIVLGIDPSDADEDLDPDDAQVVRWQAGRRLITRVDGGCWRTGSLGVVQVTYTTEDDLPEDAKQAVLRLAATMYGELTTRTTGLASETLDNYSATYVNQSTFAEAARKDPAWAIAVGRHRRLVLA